MPRLNLTSRNAIERLRAYTPPPTNYDLVPLSRRAAVLVLLYTDAKGDLRPLMVNTIDAGQAALPGGKSDSLEETPFQTARREANEEIGLPNIHHHLPRPFAVQHLCESSLLPWPARNSSCGGKRNGIGGHGRSGMDLVGEHRNSKVSLPEDGSLCNNLMFDMNHVVLVLK
ncbi:hypothetical protein P175DRAFT_0496278 [Aspergillus ochraceoroseus IBT 24754]|uniref:Nudix hydrolase domain-containing protein n=1 Tax=Aspergillus ochraceoroseus IBT 24754 TaxID=1392256 RepID=A0A2T5LMQ5_9EURO|nr:uncharacterized protein P175DRAFT_0496278 [Aspergillus ochraceoroseus IBT 24754]PTU17565.1 hypothetical protein P175DRAFT_0496278 [Aspergillus ochraceoroseus IBT 24754]